MLPQLLLNIKPLLWHFESATWNLQRPPGNRKNRRFYYLKLNRDNERANRNPHMAWHMIILQTGSQLKAKRYQKHLEWCSPPALHRNKRILFTHTCCRPVKSLHCTATPLLHCQHPLTSRSRFTIAGPLLWSVRCQPQTPRTTVLESPELTVTYFLPCASHEESKRKKAPKHTQGGKIWPELSTRARNH